MFFWEEIKDINQEDFSRLFADSLPAMDAGNYKWDMFPSITTNEQKENHIQTLFENFLEDPTGIVFQVRQDDRALQYNCGTLVDNHLVWSLGLMGTDVNGSKSYLYNDDYHTAEAIFFSAMDITSWEIQVSGRDSSILKHTTKIFDKYDKIGPIEETHLVDDSVYKVDEFDLSKGQRYDLNMKVVITEFLSNPSIIYQEPANTEIETEMSTYKYLNANTAI
jgi:hypothetical protein